MKIIAIIISLIMLPNLSWGHTMSPGFKVERALSPNFVKTYKIVNTYKHPSVFKISVYNKDWTEATGWKVQFDEYKLNPGNKAFVKIKFDASFKRKLYICSSLMSTGRNGNSTSSVTRVCSRLIINEYIQPKINNTKKE